MKVPLHNSACLVRALSWITVMVTSVLAATVIAQQESAPDPATLARLEQLGSRGVRIHDPSTIIKCNDEYWLFHTGRGVQSYRSKDLLKWELGPSVFERGPEWVREAIPANRNNHYWAPDVIRLGERYLLYYSVSSWGKNTSAIALATNRTLDPADPQYRWVDEGIVTRSTGGVDDFNAIDPGAVLDGEGRLWMTFGSFWGGIMLVQLDAKTGKRIAPDSPIYPLAKQEQIEAPCIHRHGEHYYLLVNWGRCCRGVNSTYNIRVGRSERITGPYRDKEGKDMREGGGSLLLGTDGPFIGPGHPTVLSEGGRDWLVCHFYDPTRRGRGTLALRPLNWDAEGWPVVEAERPAE